MALAAEPTLTAAPAGQPRPLYLIRHCSNSMRRLETAVDQGANAVELDLTYRHGEVRIGHPPPNPPACWWAHERGDDVDAYLSSLAQRLRERSLELAILDIKSPERDTQVWATALAKTLSAAGVPPERVVFSLPVESAVPFVSALRSGGFDVAHVDAWHDTVDPNLPDDWVDASCAAGACFLGIGSDPIVFWRPTRSWRKALTAMVDRRDRGALHHVYFWTLESRRSVRFALDLGVDGVIVNRPRRFAHILDGYDGRYVLAGAPAAY